jgi:hypothetical protein
MALLIKESNKNSDRPLSRNFLSLKLFNLTELFSALNSGLIV